MKKSYIKVIKEGKIEGNFNIETYLIGCAKLKTVLNRPEEILWSEILLKKSKS